MPERENAIRRRAFDIWLREGRPEGRARQHWALAEREIDAATALEGANLVAACGEANVAAVVTAYKTAITGLIAKGRGFPDRDLRLSVVEAILREGRRTGFDLPALKQAALQAAGL